MLDDTQTAIQVGIPFSSSALVTPAHFSGSAQMLPPLWLLKKSSHYACAKADLCWPADQVRRSTEVTTAFRAAIILAKLSIIPVPSLARYWLLWLCASAPHPGPRGPGIVSAPVPKKLLLTAGIDDGCTSARGCTAILGNFAKATFDAISKTYSYLTADLWEDTVFTRSPIRNLLTIW